MTENTISLQELTAYTKILPTYTPGDNLVQFIQSTERILHRLNNYNLSHFQRDLLLETVLGNVLGDAAVAISYETHTSWDSIKNALIKYYGDHRSLYLLESDLRRLTRGKNEPTHSYYQRIVKAQNDLIQYIQLHERNSIIQNHEIGKIRASALKQFIYGVGDPYYTKLSYVPPDTLEQALISCQQLDTENLEISLIRRTIQQAPIPKLNPPRNNSFQNNIRPQIPQNQNYFQNQNFPNFTRNVQDNVRPNLPPQQLQHSMAPLQRQPFQFNMASPQRQPFFNKQVFTKEAPKSQPFHHTQNKPTPMSGVSTINKSFQKRNTNFVPQSRPTFTSQELFNLETPQETDEIELCQQLDKVDICDSTQHDEQANYIQQDFLNHPDEYWNQSFDLPKQDFQIDPDPNELT